jgi:AAHS family 4-hydroxybenzoate transporter-like MFS transporter
LSGNLTAGIGVREIGAQMAARSNDTIDLSEFIDNGKMGRYQIWIIAICFLTSFADGLDSQVTSIAIPFLAKDLHLQQNQLGQVLSVSQLGALAGAFLFGTVADRWGRRPVIVACSLLFCLGTFATSYSNSLTSLCWLRLATGIGIGGAIPSFLALAAEYTPRRMRAVVTAIVLSAVPCGGIFAGFLGAVGLGPDAWITDWRALFQLCGLISAVICMLIVLKLPESLSFMVIKGKSTAKIARILQRFAQNETIVSPSTGFTVHDEARSGKSIRSLFTRERAAFTIIFGVMLLLTYAVLIGTLVWTPTLLRNAGMSVAQSSLALSYHNIGAIIGNVTAGAMIDRFRYSSHSVIGLFFFGATLAIVSVGYSVPHVWAVAIFSTLSGLFLAAGAASLYSMAVLTYPTHARSTGVGWGSALSRVGATMGPLVVGIFASANWAISEVFLFVGLAVMLNVVLIAAMNFVSNDKIGRIKNAVVGS